MPNPYAQVALTYVRHPFASGLRSIASLYVLLMLGVVFIVFGRSENRFNFSVYHLLVFAALSVFWAIHVKEQFADCRASLTPAFRRIHITVAAVMATVLTVLLPAALAPLMGWRPLGFVAITTLLFGAVTWSVAHQTGWEGWLILAGFLSVLTDPVRNNLEQLIHGHFEAEAFALLAIGVAISILGGIRLYRLNEEMPEYHLRMVAYREGKLQMSGPQWQAVERSLSRGWRRADSSKDALLA